MVEKGASNETNLLRRVGRKRRQRENGRKLSRIVTVKKKLKSKK